MCIKLFEGANLLGPQGVIDRIEAIASANNFRMLSLGPAKTHSSTPKVRVPHEAQNDGTLLVGKAPEVPSGCPTSHPNCGES